MDKRETLAEQLLERLSICHGSSGASFWIPHAAELQRCGARARTDAFHIWRQRFPDGQPEQLTFGPLSIGERCYLIYSLRSAFIGSTCEARYAGNAQAMPATAVCSISC